MTTKTIIASGAILLAIAACKQTEQQTAYTATETVKVSAYGFTESRYMSAPKNADTLLVFAIDGSTGVPFNQSAIRQDAEQAAFAPANDKPYFNVEIALPTPPAYVSMYEKKGDLGTLAGLDDGIFYHNHSAGMEVMPNGDVLAVYFSTPAGMAESNPATTFIQSRKRLGSLEWDMPEVFFATQGYNDQSALLFRDGDIIRFFGGGRNISNYVPFRMATSTDNGATWSFSIPQLDTAATDYEAQPVSNGFKDPDGNLYIVSDAKESQSFLWMSPDGGVHWKDMGGRTGGRHSTIVPLDDKGTLLSIGGKNADVDGWSPKNISKDWGKTWSTSTASPFPPLGSAQRPCMIRLKSGNLLLVSDAYRIKHAIAPPEGWAYGEEPVVAISEDNGKSWHVKPIPYGVPHNNRSRAAHTSLGYVTARQGDNGMIHVLTTANANNLHFEFNEAWALSDEKTEWMSLQACADNGGEVKEYKEYYTRSNGKPSRKVKSEWSARLLPGGRYLLDGAATDYFRNGSIQHTATYKMGRKTGSEEFYDEDGALLWTWDRDLDTNVGVWTRFWPNGAKKVQSTWDLLPTARDRDRKYIGYVAEGPATHWDEQGKVTAEYVFEGGALKAESE